MLESGHVADKLGSPKAERSDLSWSQKEQQALTSLKSHQILFWKRALAFAGLSFFLFFFPSNCKEKSFSDFEVFWDPCVRGAALSRDNQPPSLTLKQSQQLQVAPGTRPTANLTMLRWGTALQGAGVWPKMLFNLGDRSSLYYLGIQTENPSDLLFTKLCACRASDNILSQVYLLNQFGVQLPFPAAAGFLTIRQSYIHPYPWTVLLKTACTFTVFQLCLSTLLLNVILLPFVLNQFFFFWKLCTLKPIRYNKPEYGYWYFHHNNFKEER